MPESDAYHDTLKRMEPIAMVDRDAALASIAVSLKRIADALEAPPAGANISTLLWEISQRLGDMVNK